MSKQQASGLLLSEEDKEKPSLDKCDPLLVWFVDWNDWKRTG